MGPELVGIHPRELKFTFELKKQSSCSVQLVNNSDQYVAFKVKTTSPKRYCVRPNTGIIQPKSTCDFTVTMQAQRVAPTDMQCKDKFLIQSTIVPSGTIAEDITTSMFAKDSGKYIEENKLKVIFVSPPSSPVLVPINGSSKAENESSTLRERVQIGVENFPPPRLQVATGEELKLTKDVDLKPAKDAEELKITKDVDLKPAKDAEEWKIANDVHLKPAKDTEEDAEEWKIANDVHLKPAKGAEEWKISNDADLKPAKDAEELKQAKYADSKLASDLEDLKKAEDVEASKRARYMEESKLAKDVEESKLAKDVEELNSNLRELESKLSEAEVTISRLRVERSTTIEEKQTLQQELALLRRSNGVRKVQVGFPFLFVCMVALVSVAIGYLLRS